MFTLSVDRAYLFAHPERELTPEESARYEEALGHRSRGVPAQYITGHQEFWGLDLIVGPAVLIPRPETEHLVETVLELARSYARVHHSAVSPQGSLAENGVSASDAAASTDLDAGLLRGIAGPSTEEPASHPVRHIAHRGCGHRFWSDCFSVSQRTSGSRNSCHRRISVGAGNCRGECCSSADGLENCVSRWRPGRRIARELV